MRIQQNWAIVLALSAASASAAEAPIQSVTLYPGSATVERAVQVAPGTTQVEITGLLANFTKDTAMPTPSRPGWCKGNQTARFDLDHVIDYPAEGLVQGLR